MIITSKTQIYQCELSPQQSLARIWKSNTDQQKSKIPFGHVFFHQLQLSFCVFGEPMEIEQVAVAISLLVVSWVKNCQTKPERGSKTHEKNTTGRFEAQKNEWKMVKQSPPLSCEEFP